MLCCRHDRYLPSPMTSPQVHAEGSPPVAAGRGRRKIGCLVVLIGLVVAMLVFTMSPTVNREWVQARKTGMVGLSLVTAIENHRLNNGGANPATGDTAFATNDRMGIAMLNVLVGNPPGRKSYLQLPRSEKGKPGLVYEADGRSVAGLLDAWGNPYRVVIDTDYDGILVVDIAGKTETVRDQNAVVYSAGKDGKPGTPDDIRSWK